MFVLRKLDQVQFLFIYVMHLKFVAYIRFFISDNCLRVYNFKIHHNKAVYIYLSSNSL